MHIYSPARNGKLRLVLTSDLHGRLPEVPSCDVLLIAGDLCPMENHDPAYQYNWLHDAFIPWLARTPARQRLFVAGNHDFVFALEPGWIKTLDWPGVYLQDSGLEWEGVTFWGSPWANELTGWPFTAPEEEMRMYWSLIPRQTQVLLVHGPPHGIGDQVVGRRSGDVLNVGSRTLRERLDDLPRLKLVVFGHIHEGAGVYEHGATTLVNASLMDHGYNPVYPPTVWEL